MTATVVCGVDGTWRSWASLAFASELANRAGLRLQVFHAAQVVGEQALRARGDRIHALIREVLGRHDVPVMLAPGAAADRMLAAAGHASLVVVGTSGASAARQALRGSISGTVTRRSPCPVVVVPPRAADAFEGTTLLCAVRDRRDLPVAATAACWARDLGVQLALACVVGPPRLALVAGVAAVPPPPVISARESISAAKRELAEVAEAIEAVTPCRVLAGSTSYSPGRVLRRMAAQENAALVVVGPPRRGVMLDAAGGSPTRSLLRGGTCPVMVCPRAEHALAIRGASPLTATPSRRILRSASEPGREGRDGGRAR